MENAESGNPIPEDANQLNRSRSLKYKQLVRSQAIRESQSPPRTASASPPDGGDANCDVTPLAMEKVAANAKCDVTPPAAEEPAPDAKETPYRNGEQNDNYDEKKQPVEIQITGGGWDVEGSEQRQRTRRWLGQKQLSDPRDLLSNNPRVACVCGACAASSCPNCRGRRRRRICAIKQDSGIACSEDCPDCNDTDDTGNDGHHKSESVETEQQVYYCRCQERKEKPRNISLTRTDSEEKIEPTGPELVAFLKETLNKSARDRLNLLKIEKELHALVNDPGRTVVRFPVMTSYGRMLVHRCASLFQLCHGVDQGRANVLVSKTGTSGGRIPCTSFKQWCTATFPPGSPLKTQTPTEQTNAKSILKRDTNSLDETGIGPLSTSRSKSLEQREKDYEQMKRRIFSSDNCAQDEGQWPWNGGTPVKLLTPDTGRNKLIKVQSVESGAVNGGNGANGERRGVAKSHSFGGCGGDDPVHRVLSRHGVNIGGIVRSLAIDQEVVDLNIGDLASSSWRLSPSSSGYKSLRSTDSVTPSPTGGASPEPSPIVCAVVGINNVPAGALLLHPKTGRPLTNPDGSYCYFDPANPPLAYDSLQDDTEDQNGEKKRGKLEKQQSFIDHDSESTDGQLDDSKNKCDCCHRCNDKTAADQSSPDPPSPRKQREKAETATVHAECKPFDPANQSSLNERREFEPANHGQPINAPPEITYEIGYDSQQAFEAQANQAQAYEAQANHAQAYEAQYDQTQAYDMAANQPMPGDVMGNNASILTNQSQDMYALNQQYALQAVNNDEASPQMLNNYLPPDMVVPHSGHGHAIHQARPDMDMYVGPFYEPSNLPKIRPATITHPAHLQPGYPYQYRMDQLPGVYQPPVVQPEEPRQLPATSPEEPAFRIDPSYPYPAIDYPAQCGACVDPNMRNFNVPYGHMEAPPQPLPPVYPINNGILPQPQMHPYGYQEAAQWPQMNPQMPMVPVGRKVPDVYHPLYPSMYPYNVLYHQQLVPQQYPLLQPLYNAADKPPSRSNSVQPAVLASMLANNVPTASTLVEIPAEMQDARAPSVHSVDNCSNEIAAKIQQIKEQMAHMSTSQGQGQSSRPPRQDNWRRRNPANGILGSYPAPLTHRGDRTAARPINEETPLASAAQAIVNSIRSMQVRNNNFQDNRREYQPRGDRGEYRRRDRDGERPERERERDRHYGWDRQQQERPRHLQFQYRPPFIFRPMAPGNWTRRTPGFVHPLFNQSRKPHPDNKNTRRDAEK